MRGKRSKQYRKLMEQFSMAFGFREPYQVLVDAEMVEDACRFKMELSPALQRTLHGGVKPMITQCEIRKLYARKDEKGMRDVIESAKTLERRRCGHHPDQYPEPLGTQECLREVVDPKETGQNKHRYVVASQSQDVRRMLRAVRGVPLIYIKRSVMILEPMADESAQVRAREEKMKFRAGINRALGKRKRQGHDEEEEQDRIAKDQKSTDAADDKSAQDAEKKMKKPRGPKGPNPLSVKKAKKKPHELEQGKGPDGSEAPTEGTGKRKRRRKNKSAGEADGGGDDITATSVQ